MGKVLALGYSGTQYGPLRIPAVYTEQNRSQE